MIRGKSEPPANQTDLAIASHASRLFSLFWCLHAARKVGKLSDLSNSSIFACQCGAYTSLLTTRLPAPFSVESASTPTNSVVVFDGSNYCTAVSALRLGYRLCGKVSLSLPLRSTCDDIILYLMQQGRRDLSRFCTMVLKRNAHVATGIYRYRTPEDFNSSVSTSRTHSLDNTVGGMLCLQ